MPDSTHTFAPPRRLTVARPALIALVATLLLGLAPARVLADGDPASDVLATEPVFLPQDARIGAAQQARIAGVVRSAQRQGLAVRVALIATPADLGSISQLWRMPASYSRFLGEELSLVFHGTLLVVMPNGLGMYRTGGVPPGVQSSVAGVAPPGSGSAMGPATVAAIQRLAGATGRRLSIQPTRTPRPASSGSASGDLIAWVAFAAGATLIALAWTASLRARPVRLARHTEPTD